MGNTKTYRRNRIRQRIRKVISGTSDFPRLSVFRSNKEIYCQLIDDINGKTLIQSSSRDKSIIDLKLATNMEVAFNVGKVIAEKAIKEGINKNVTINETINPKVIIQPKSIIGLMPLSTKEKNAHIVVRTV